MVGIPQKQPITLALLVLAVSIAAFHAVASKVLHVSTPFVVVSGKSMIPTLYTGDIVIVYKPPPREIKIGDIIVYRSLQGNLVIHRVIEVVKGHGCTPVCYVTKGDNNLQPDTAIGLQPPHGVDYRDVIGVVVSLKLSISNSCRDRIPLRIPYLGLLTLYIRGS